MSSKASAYAKELVVCPSGEMISAREKLVLMVLADSHQSRAGRFTFPSVDTIAEDARCDRRSCQRYLDALERKGVIRRLRPKNQGSGMTTFYFFPALEEVPEGWQDAALFFGGRAAEGRQKGGGRAANARPALLERAQERELEQEQKQILTPPNPLASEGEVGPKKHPGTSSRVPEKPNAPERPKAPERASASRIEAAVEQVCSALGISNRRKRGPVMRAIELAAEKGELPATIALDIVAAVRKQADLHARRQLKFQFGLHKFLGDGIWRDENRWGWDNQEIRLQAEARAGSY